jgi:hypothetical protein
MLLSRYIIISNSGTTILFKFEKFGLELTTTAVKSVLRMLVSQGEKRFMQFKIEIF